MTGFPLYASPWSKSQYLCNFYHDQRVKITIGYYTGHIGKIKDFYGDHYFMVKLACGREVKILRTALIPFPTKLSRFLNWLRGND